MPSRFVAGAILSLALTVVAVHGQQQDDPIIAAARKAAARFVKASPDYLVKRTTMRYVGMRPTAKSPGSDARGWSKPDTITADVTSLNGGEAYSNITVNGRPVKKPPVFGAWSAGEFSNLLRDLLALKTAALFTNQQVDSIGSHLAYRYDFAVDKAHSTWDLEYGDNSTVRYSPAFGGRIWIDGRTGEVLRIEKSARGIPDAFPLNGFDSSTDYDFVAIGDKRYCLPTHSEDTMCLQGSKVCYRNETVFRDYRKFRADSSITFEEGAN